MKGKTRVFYLTINLVCTLGLVCVGNARDLTFCGEQIPVDNGFVANKLMNVIRGQMPYVNMPSLRRKAQQWFPYIEYCLRATGMPMDLKYIPIVESGFTNATSRVGAQGFWQFMPETAKGLGLQVNTARDERNDPYKATIAALKKLAGDYKEIQRRYNVSSWALTAAAYNCGLGCIYKKLKADQGSYFTMSLNAETAVYVYKIIAVKELFEYPELYMKTFRYNVFSTDASKQNNVMEKADTSVFQSMDVVVKKAENTAPDDSKIKSVLAPTASELATKDDESFREGAMLVAAEVLGKYSKFKDGDAVTIKLQEDLSSLSGLWRKGALITGKGWVIDDRVYIDLGFNTNNVILYDVNSEQGVARAALKNKAPIILRVQN